MVFDYHTILKNVYFAFKASISFLRPWGPHHLNIFGKGVIEQIFVFLFLSHFCPSFHTFSYTRQITWEGLRHIGRNNNYSISVKSVTDLRGFKISFLFWAVSEGWPGGAL